MSTPAFARVLRRAPLALLLLSTAPAALAQSYPGGATVEKLPSADDPAEKLARALRTLAAEPNDMSALLSAGDNALALGDPNAAVGFFGRAAGIEPRNGEAKAGLGSALVQMERPAEALRLFADARKLGVPQARIASDEGLAYDLTGDQRRAQQDYAQALAARPDDEEARRRLALSLGISDNRTAALAALDPLIRKKEIAAWRAQTFVLAMTGDAAGAQKITDVMLPEQSALLQPFLVRLASLSPADKARAVHFGEMPENGRTYSPSQLANIGPMPTYEPLPSQKAAAQSQARAKAESKAETAAVTPRSDLAPVTAPPTPRPAPARQPAPQPVRRTELASATPTRAPTTAAPTARASIDPNRPLGPIAERDAIFALGEPYRVPVRIIRRPAPAQSRPNIAVAMNPAPRPSVEPASAPPSVRTSEARTTPPILIAGQPASAAPLPTAAASGHGDLAPDATVRHTSTNGAAVHALQTRPAPATEIATASSADVPLPTAAASGHYDLPHDATARRKPEDTAIAHQPKARPRPAAHDEPAPDETATRDEDAHHGARSRHTEATADSDSDEKTASRSEHERSHAHDRKDAARSDEDRSSTKADEDAAKSTSAKTRHGDKDSGAKAKKTDKTSKKTGKAEKAEPARVYVQVAGGADKDDLDKAWSGVKKKAPELMKGHHPSTTPLRATNRLLVGPFKDEDSAQAFVNKMAGKGLSGFIFKSDKGQKVEKIDTDQ